MLTLYAAGPNGIRVSGSTLVTILVVLAIVALVCIIFYYRPWRRP